MSPCFFFLGGGGGGGSCGGSTTWLHVGFSKSWLSTVCLHGPMVLDFMLHSPVGVWGWGGGGVNKADMRGSRCAQ